MGASQMNSAATGLGDARLSPRNMSSRNFLKQVNQMMTSQSFVMDLAANDNKDAQDNELAQVSKL